MSVLLLAAIAVPGGLAAVLLAERPRLPGLIGGLTTLLAVVVAASIDAEDTVPLAGTVVAGSDGLRTLALTWALGVLLIGLADVLVGTGGLILGPSLLGLGIGVLGLSVADAGIGFALLTAGGIAAALGPLVAVRVAAADAAQLGRRFLRPLAAAGALALVVVAWSASPAGPFAAIDPLGDLDPAFEVSLGLGLLGLVAAVVVRMGAIPTHVWAARYAESMPVGSVPAALGWGSAGFALVALGWVDLTIAPASASLVLERGVIAVVAATSILLAGTAAVLHDDLEHILGYSIVQDAGVALLAFAVISPESAAAARDWLVGIVAVKTALAAWVLVTRATFGARRLADLRGWARSSPILGVAFGLIILGAVGLPGMAVFEARGTLTDLALATPFDLFILLGAFSPLVYLGRIGLAGIDRMSDAVRAARGTRPRFRGYRPAGWTAASAAAAARAVPGAVEANRFAFAAMAVVVVAGVGLAVAVGGLGETASEQPLGGEPGVVEPTAGLEGP